MKSPFARSASRRPATAASARAKAANASALSIVALGVAGVMLGTGVASTAIGVSDGVTWLSDISRGELLLYNPATRTIETAYRVAAPGSPLKVTQHNGQVAITDERTGQVTTIDMTTMAKGGQRAGNGSKVIMSAGHMFVADLGDGRISAVDPVTAVDLGTPFVNDKGIVDVAVDERGTVWLVGQDGVVKSLNWSDAESTFTVGVTKQVPKLGGDGVLTPHAKGVTVFGPAEGIVAQVGTPSEVYLKDDAFIGLDPAGSAPADLVPFTLPSGEVVLLDHGQPRRVSGRDHGCRTPKDAVVFNDNVFVVCAGESKVSRLTRDGRPAGPPIKTPGGDAEPVNDEGRLLLNVPGSDQGVEIGRSGEQVPFDRRAPRPATPLSEGGEVVRGRGPKAAPRELDSLPGNGNHNGPGGIHLGADGIPGRNEVVVSDNSRHGTTITEAGEDPHEGTDVGRPKPPKGNGHKPRTDDNPGRGRDQAPGQNQDPHEDKDPKSERPEDPGRDDKPGRDDQPGKDEKPGKDKDDNPGRGHRPEPADPVTSQQPEPVNPGPQSPIEPIEPGPEEPMPDPVESDAPAPIETGAPVPEDPVQPQPEVPVPGQPPVAPTQRPSAPAPTAPAPSAQAPSMPVQPTPPPAMLTPPATNNPVAPTPGKTITWAPAPSTSAPGPAPTRTASVPPRTPAPATSAPAPSARPTMPKGTPLPGPKPTQSTTTPTPRRTVPAPKPTPKPVPKPTPTPAPTKAALAKPASVRASASGDKVSVSWTHPGADSFTVSVGGRSTKVTGKSATISSVPAGTHTVTVTATKAGSTASATTTVTVSGAAKPTPKPSPKPTPKPSPKPSPKPTTSGPPAKPSVTSASWSGKSASVKWSHSGGADYFEVYCNDVGTVRASAGARSATVSCGISPSNGAWVQVGVQAFKGGQGSGVAYGKANG